MSDWENEGLLKNLLAPTAADGVASTLEPIEGIFL